MFKRILFLKVMEALHVRPYLSMTGFALIAQELKSNLQPDINDTLMYYLETSTV